METTTDEREGWKALFKSKFFFHQLDAMISHGDPLPQQWIDKIPDMP